jgi:hypothetical protein
MLKSSSLSVTTPAADRSILTVPELRAAVGLTNGSRDVELKLLGARIAAGIVSECSVAAAGASQPTLREETLRETFRQTRDYRSARPFGHEGDQVEALVLSRRPIAEIVSVTLDDNPLDGNCDYEVDAAAGLIYRLFTDARVAWRARKVIVVYQAGWQEVPDDLKQAASRLANVWWTASGQDPNVRVDLTQDVGRIEYFGNPLGAGAIPADVMDLLGPYINYPVV